MHIQGDLQAVFDALYQMGVIDPLLDKDWEENFYHRPKTPELEAAIRTVNESQGNLSTIINRLSNFDQQTLEYLAMEVAREFADYSQRSNLQ